MTGSWRDLVDGRWPAERSLLLRYWRALGGLEPALSLERLAAVSLGEGARVRPLGEHGGVELHVCDETSGMASGTYKSLDACVTVAMLERQGARRVVTSSGGNLGQALARYCHARGIEVFCFQPRTTRYKLDGGLFAASGVHLVSAALPEPEIKALARRFAERYRLRHVPELPWRLAASATRALFLLEMVQDGPRPARWIAQAMCAGYGPLGIYDCFARLVDAGMLAPERVPRLLGVQQLANAPMVRAWSEGAREIGERHRQGHVGAWLEPGLYNTDPGPSYPRLCAHLERFGGTLVAVDEHAWQRHAGMLVGRLADVGVRLARRPDGEVLEKAGLLAAVGLLEAIERGHVAAGERALTLLTGGVRTALGAPAPDAVSRNPIEIDGSRSADAWVEALGERWSLDAAA